MIGYERVLGMLDTGDVYGFAGCPREACERRFYPGERVWEYKSVLHRVGADVEEVVRSGVCGRWSFVMGMGKAAVAALDGSCEVAVRSAGEARSMAMVGDGVCVLCESDGFRVGLEGVKVARELGSEIKVLEDPREKERFFCCSVEKQELRVVWLRDGEIRDWVLQRSVVDFDVSNEYILYVCGAVARVFRREDTAVAPVFEKRVESAAVYIDNECYYEFDEGAGVLSMWDFGHKLIQRVERVAKVYKCGEIAIQFLDGSVSGVRKRPMAYEKAPIAALYDGKKLVSWFSFEDQPVVESDSAESKETQIESTSELVFMKLMAALDAQRAFTLASAHRLADHYDKELDAISLTVDKLLGKVPGYTAQQCSALMGQRRFADAMVAAARQNIGVFRDLCANGALASALEKQQFVSDDILQILQPLLILFKENPKSYAQILLDTLTALELDEDDDPSFVLDDISDTVFSMLTLEDEQLLQTLRQITDTCSAKFDRIHQ